MTTILNSRASAVPAPQPGKTGRIPIVSKLVTNFKGLALLGACCVLLTVLCLRLGEWMDRASSPWAYAKPSLLGDWQGEAWADNTRLRLVLSLSRYRTDHWHGEDLRGQVVLCDSTGRVQSYPLARGTVEDRQGRRSVLSLWPPNPDEIPGLRPERIVLIWDGGTTLRGQAELGRVEAGGIIRMLSADPETGHPIPFLLHPAGATGQICTTP
jgi:hypothetical protein